MQHNKLGVALANKLARIAWSVLNSESDFDWKEHELAAAV
jgi:transposase